MGISRGSTQKTVLVGVTGCIAVYKACELVRALQKKGYRVKVVMTKNATHFVDPTTFRALTNEPVAVDLFAGAADPIYHISLAAEADLFIIAPCTANVAAKIACGIADDLLTTTALATQAPLVVAPAMNVHMYENVATQQNLKTLASRGITIVEADEGYLACGEVGKGRMPDPEYLACVVDDMLRGSKDVNDGALVLARAAKKDLAGKKVMITAGPTVEPIDPVRFISNPSSGKMGYALAFAARDRGANVVLVSGPVSLDPPAGVELIPVKTACDMMSACEKSFPDCDIAIFSAAVSDMRPACVSDVKLKKGTDDAALSSISLVENPDILKTCGHAKKPGQVVIGFAAETNDVVDNARKKLASKGAHAIVANDVSAGKGFGVDEDEALFVTDGSVKPFGLTSKQDLAQAILDEAVALLAKASLS